MRRLLAVVVVALALPASAFAWGGTYQSAADGTPIDIQVSNAYPVDEALPQSWADYLGTLLHGSELGSLHVQLMSLAQVRRVCGLSALACYDSRSETMYVSAVDVPDGPSAKAVVAHEYGHHVAAHLDNGPWSALDYGPKRWATYMNVCARTESGEFHPGDEGRAYQLNPGEAWAESYRWLNEQNEGIADPGWDIVDPLFVPDATALELIREDVTTPWTGNTLKRYSGSFGYGAVRTFKVQTPLDGNFAATLKAPVKYTLTLLDGSNVVASGRTVKYDVCGARTLTLRVARNKGALGTFTLAVSKP